LIGNARKLVRLSLVLLLVIAATTAIGAQSAFAAAPSVEEEFVLNVSSTSATLNAKINPGGSETSYRFEYGTSDAYGSRIPVPDHTLGLGSEGVAVASHVQGLEPSTTYHYRVVAINGEGEERSADQTLTTEAAAGMPVSADGRQWELVSPATKYGALVQPITFEGSPVQAAADGDAMAFATDGPTEKNPEGSRSLEMTELLAMRGPAGWSAKDIQPPEQSVFGLELGVGQSYRLFSSDLGQSIVEPRGSTLLSSEATEQTLYLRDSASGVFKPLLTAGNVAKGVTFGGPNNTGGQRFADATPDLSHVIIESQVPLTESAVKSSPYSGLYEWANGQVQLVSVLPDGTVAPSALLGSRGPGVIGTTNANTQNAVSPNGQYVVFAESGADSHLYLRDVISEETVKLDAPQGGPASGSSEEGLFEGASSEGNHVFFAYGEQLTSDSHAQGEERDLYEFSVEPGSKLSGRLTDLSVDPNSGEAADVQGGIPGTGEDGSYVYFVAQGRLTNEPRPGCLAELTVTEREAEEKSQGGRCRATRGGDNLYLSAPDAANPDGRTTGFIATLTPADHFDWTFNSAERTSRVSPNGRYIAFMSDAPLTDYDNRDANSGTPDEEVYTYNAATGRLSCASCNPTGGRPVGVIESESGHQQWPKYDSTGLWRERGLAANIPAWTGMENNVAIYQSRYLSNDGRLFFNSADALVPTDTNGQVDVYEYSPAGVGGCSASAVTYSPRSGGCVNLLSSGTASEESAFLDASESGDDVFFLTAAQLARKDYDSSYDVYDAHLCSSEAPCIAEPSTVPPCTTSDSCREAPGAQPATFGPPSSATFSGAGNVAPASVKPEVVKKKATKVRKRAGAPRTCRNKRGRRRTMCESKARKRSGAGRSGRRISKGGK
jgi:Tol biopolymer transport system component